MRDVATSDEAQLGGWTAPSFEQTSSRKFQHKQEARADASQPPLTCSLLQWTPAIMAAQ